MLTPYRPRRGRYALSSSRGDRGGLFTAVVALALLIGMLYVLLKIFLWFSSSATDSRSPAQVHVERGGSVNVMIDGGDVQAAQDGLPLYPGDILSTGGHGHVRVSFFDGTVLRLDEDSELKISASEQVPNGTSSIEAELTRGRVWVSAPAASGTTVRSFVTPSFTFSFPERTEAIVGLTQAAVYDSAGLGANLKIGSSAVVIGEGQVFALPEQTADIGTDLYAYRAPLQGNDPNATFLTESRQVAGVAAQALAATSSVSDIAALLTVTSPADGAVIESDTVLVAGTIGADVSRVRVNGYQAALNTEHRSFSQELAVESGSLVINVEALDAKGLVLTQTQRTITASPASTTPPTVTSPARDGQVYRTQQTEITLRGGAPSGTQAVEVNGYRLQLFKPGSTTWSYLARTDLGNYAPGRNDFRVVAFNAAGKPGPAASLVVLLEPGTEGVVSTGATLPTAASSSSLREADLPKNDPIHPGSLVVTSPATGTTYTMTGTGSEVVIEGTTGSDTDSVWVNGYRLQLYKSGKTTWNYVAREAMGNLKRGQNVYRIVTRNQQNAILDILSYTVTY